MGTRFRSGEPPQVVGDARLRADHCHGLGNSIDFTVIYLGLYPGVGS